MPRVCENLRHRVGFDDFAFLHHRHIVGNFADDAEVMRNEEHRHIMARLELLQELEDLRLNGDVQGGCRLVGDKKIGPVGERHGDHHALALAAGELMREGAETRCRIRNANFLQKLDNAVLDLLGSPCAMQLQDFTDLPRDRMQGIERGHRLLKDHGDLGASDLAQPRLAVGQKILSLEEHLALYLGCAAKQTHDRESGDRFAGARFADER